MLTKKLADVDLTDIKTLCENKALESRFLDFKADAIGTGEKDKREFLANVSAFANASGGDLMLGVKTKDGTADEICGIRLDDPDQEKLRLGNIVRDGLEPRVSGIDMAWLPIGGKARHRGDPGAPQLVGAASGHLPERHEYLFGQCCRE